MPPLDLSAYREIVVLTGAGVSVASGLPTYRGLGGLWKSVNVESFATAAAVRSSPERVWDFFAEIRSRVGSAAPNAAHLALASAEARLSPSQRLTILTQNVDGLHQRAGSKRVVELHGTLWRSRCTACNFSRPEALAAEALPCPPCPTCGAPLRPDVVLFDEELPVDAEWESKQVLRNCDLFLAVGTSGTVSPASNFVRGAEYAGARTIYVNLTPMQPPNPAFREVRLGRAEELLPALLRVSQSPARDSARTARRVGIEGQGMLAEKLLGGLYGLLIGDAVGVPYEFSSPSALPPLERIEMPPPPGFARAHRSAPAGAWSDDGAQALCLLASLLGQGGLDLDDLGRRFVNWHDWGYLAVDGIVFDIGIQTARAVGAIRSGTPAVEAGSREERHNGNGSLMRVLPLALWHTGSDADLVSLATRQSLVTHGHARSQLCCALYCLWARATLSGVTNAYDHAAQTLRRLIADDGAFTRELEEHVRPDDPPRGKGSGYVVDCLHSARLALEEASFERVIQRAISLGDDTDTTAAVAGGIAGIRHGLGGIPARWLDALSGRELVEPLAKALLAHRGLEGSSPSTMTFPTMKQ